MTGGRLQRVQRFLNDETFLCTYGDGIADVKISDSVSFHKERGKLATMTATRPTSRFGVVELGKDGIVEKFREKPRVDDWVNIGYFVFEPGIFSYLKGDNSVLEEDLLHSLAIENQISAFKHDGFWQPMDTQREAEQLNEIWNAGSAPWKTWR